MAELKMVETTPFRKVSADVDEPPIGAFSPRDKVKTRRRLPPKEEPCWK